MDVLLNFEGTGDHVVYACNDADSTAFSRACASTIKRAFIVAICCAIEVKRAIVCSIRCTIRVQRAVEVAFVDAIRVECLGSS